MLFRSETITYRPFRVIWSYSLVIYVWIYENGVKNLNFVNNKKSDLLAKIDVRGNAYEKVRYDASPQQPIRDCSTSSHVNSITISVRDKDGELFDFKGTPLEFELELN